MSEVRRNRAELAREKKATFGADVDLLQYKILAEDQAEALDLDTLTTKDREKIIQSGVDLEEKGLMAAMNTIEISDRDRARRYRARQVVESTD